MKFLRRPLTVEAIRFNDAEVFARTKGLRLDIDTGVSYRWPQEADWPPEPVVLTREGILNITDGDWIVTYPGGRTEPMRHAEFHATFERAIETPTVPFKNPTRRGRR